jgi:hypothetical protein
LFFKDKQDNFYRRKTMDNLQILFAKDLTDEQASTLTGGVQLTKIECLDPANETDNGIEPYIRLGDGTSGNIAWRAGRSINKGESVAVNKFNTGTTITVFDSDPGDGGGNDDNLGKFIIPRFKGTEEIDTRGTRIRLYYA